MLTIGIPLRNPTMGQLNWALDVVQRVRDIYPEIVFVISIHSCEDLPKFKLINGLTVLSTAQQYSYDQNVYCISKTIVTKYWMLLAATDNLVFSQIPPLLDLLRQASPSTAVFFTEAVFDKARKLYLPRRLGFLSAYIFSRDYFNCVCPSLRGFGGWIHTAVFFMAMQSKEIVVPVNFAIVEEDIEVGFIKPWVASGGYLAYQVALGRLVNWLLPQHPARLACLSHATGRWPYDIIKAVQQGAKLDRRERRFIKSWVFRHSGPICILNKLMAQIWDRLTKR